MEKCLWNDDLKKKKAIFIMLKSGRLSSPAFDWEVILTQKQSILGKPSGHSFKLCSRIELYRW